MNHKALLIQTRREVKWAVVLEVKCRVTSGAVANLLIKHITPKLKPSTDMMISSCNISTTRRRSITLDSKYFRNTSMSSKFCRKRSISMLPPTNSYKMISKIDKMGMLANLVLKWIEEMLPFSWSQWTGRKKMTINLYNVSGKIKIIKRGLASFWLQLSREPSNCKIVKYSIKICTIGTLSKFLRKECLVGGSLK